MTLELLYNAVLKEPNYCQAAVPGAEDELKKDIKYSPSSDPFGRRLPTASRKLRLHC